MPYVNKCPILHVPITKENSFLIKVLKKKDGEKDIYYYISDKETLESLVSCPLTRREGNYYALKMSSQDLSILESENLNELIEDVTALSEIDKKHNFSWSMGSFRSSLMNHPVNQLPIVPIRIQPPPRQIISNYKANIFRHPITLNRLESFRLILNPYPFAREITELMDKSLLEEHDLMFLFSSFKFSFTLDNPYKTALQNAILGQLARYFEGFIVLTNTISIIIDLLQNNVSSSTYFSILNILLIDAVVNNFQSICRKNKAYPLQENVVLSILKVPSQLARPASFVTTAISAATNGYEFVNTTFNFFHRKYASSNPAPYAVPDDLANLRRELRGQLN